MPFREAGLGALDRLELACAGPAARPCVELVLVEAFGRVAGIAGVGRLAVLLCGRTARE